MDAIKSRAKTVERIFNDFEVYYKDRWLKNFVSTDRINSDFKKNVHKTMWIHGLVGCTKSEIDKAILYYINLAMHHPTFYPPSVQQFFTQCKKYKKQKRYYPYDNILRASLPNKLLS
jgi:hypothetical protein